MDADSMKASWHGRSDLVEGVIHPGLETAQESLIGVFEEMEGQLDKESNRLVELRKVREDDPGQSRSFFPADITASKRGKPLTTAVVQIHSTLSTICRLWRASMWRLMPRLLRALSPVTLLRLPRHSPGRRRSPGKGYFR